MKAYGIKRAEWKIKSELRLATQTSLMNIPRGRGEDARSYFKSKCDEKARIRRGFKKKERQSARNQIGQNIGEN